MPDEQRRVEKEVADLAQQLLDQTQKVNDIATILVRRIEARIKARQEHGGEN